MFLVKRFLASFHSLILNGSILILLTTDGALALGLLVNGLVEFHTSQFRIDHDSSAVLANDDLLVHLDVELTLRRNLVEATTASITLHVNDTQTVAGILTDTLVTGKQTLFDLQLQFLGSLLELLLFSTSLAHDLIELALLLLEGDLTVLDQLFSLLQVLTALLNLNISLANFLVTEFDLQFLELDFLAQRVVFAVVLHVVQLTLVAFHACL